MFAFCLKSFREKLCLRGEYLDLKQSPSYKSFPFPNETPNLEATEPGARSKREASGPEPGDELPGPGSRTSPPKIQNNITAPGCTLVCKTEQS